MREEFTRWIYGGASAAKRNDEMVKDEWNEVLEREAQRLSTCQKIPDGMCCRWIEPHAPMEDGAHIYSCQVRVEAGQSYCPEHRAQVFESRESRLAREARRILPKAA